MSLVPISSWEDLQSQVSAILERLNADRTLGLAAAANPVLALEELGYEIETSARPLIEARLRFGPKLARRVLKLVDKMRDQLGHDIDPDDEDAVRGVIGELRLMPKPMAKAQPPLRLRDEDLEPLRNAHPFISTLLDYRKLSASRPRLAPRAAFDAIRSGERTSGVIRVTGRLKGANAPESNGG